MPAFAQEVVPRTLTVVGQGVISVPTVKAQVRLGINVEADTAESAQTEAARRSTAVIELLRAREVEELETTGIRLQPRYASGERRQARRLIGYQATNLVSFQVPSERAGEIMDAAIAAGATRIDGIGFVAAEEAISSAREQALQAAVEDAQQQ
ncbi:MAG: SIMPL domain-containing protein, partial [Cyanobacteria bacterium J06641_5]